MPAEAPPLVDYAEALDRVLSHARSPGVTRMPLSGLLGAVLAEPVVTTYDMPFFDTAAMDGYALTADDLEAIGREGHVRLPVVGTAPAGWDPSGTLLRPGEALHILTGAAVPPGVAGVVMQEDASLDGGHVTLGSPARPGQHVRTRGEEFCAGDQVAPAGAIVTAGLVAAIAASGHPDAVVYRRPRVGVVVTGDELVAPGTPLTPGRIYDANSYGVVASLQAMGFEAPPVRFVSDRLSDTEAVLGDLLACCDVVVTTGGVSVGEFDIVKAALRANGVSTVVWGVAIKPGKPFFMGEVPGGAAVFGLPGNPVAVMVTFRTLVRPYLERCLGLPGRPVPVTARLGAAIRKKAGRLEFVPCRLIDGVADPAIKRGSHMLGTLTDADGLVLFPKHLEALEAGAEVEVIRLEGRLLA